MDQTVRLRVVLCDNDAFMLEMVEAAAEEAGHEVVGIADTTADAVRLIEAARPDVVILDLSLGYNTDFDIVATSISVDAQVIVFSHNADAQLLDRYDPKPHVVAKPDLIALEQVLGRLRPREGSKPVVHDRRRRNRVASGVTPIGLEDARAFFEAVNAAEAGDALVAIVETDQSGPIGLERLQVARDTDRILVSGGAVRYFLAGAGSEGAEALLERLAGAQSLPAHVQETVVVVCEGEPGADAFERLKKGGP
jgi:chemotaxis response regulator CheB